MSARGWMITVNVLGGIAVLGSYAQGIATHPAPAAVLWGAVPTGLQPLYQVSMLLAAAGYLAFAYFLCLRLPTPETRVAGRFGYGALFVPHVLILGASALWMPLTFAYAAAPSSGLWWAVRGVLLVVALGALLLVAMIAALSPRSPRVPWLAALVGSVVFALHVTVLDAILWPALYHSS